MIVNRIAKLLQFERKGRMTQSFAKEQSPAKLPGHKEREEEAPLALFLHRDKGVISHQCVACRSRDSQRRI